MEQSCRKALVVLMCIFSMCIQGCATAYMIEIRGEYASCGKAEGIYHGEEEYPRAYPATFICATEEIPAWWWASGNSLEREYKYAFWILGAPLSLIDLPISVITDTAMLPYDIKQIKEKKE